MFYDQTALSLSLSLLAGLSKVYVEITLTFSARVDLKKKKEKKIRPESVSTLTDRFESLISEMTAGENCVRSYKAIPFVRFLSLSIPPDVVL